MPVEAGGGFRNEAALELVRGSRVAKVVIGTSAVEDKAFLLRAWMLGPGRIVVAVDAEDGLVKTRGWQEQSDVRRSTWRASWRSWACGRCSTPTSAGTA